MKLFLPIVSSSLLLLACMVTPEDQRVRVTLSANRLFDGGSQSIVARTVGHAEGTLNADGSKTRHYASHIDPGNGVKNVGLFSYQHCPHCTPAEADRRQLKRLEGQTEMLKKKAAKRGVRLDTEALLNGIDLANQAPLAALDDGGYIDRIREAHALQLKGSEAVLWARTHSYKHPVTGQWEAPGLGNRLESIQADQKRRQLAIREVLKNGR